MRGTRVGPSYWLDGKDVGENGIRFITPAQVQA